MPALENQDRRQRAVLWAASTYDDYGQLRVSDPTDIRVRWVSKRSQMIDPKGQKIGVDATAVVGQAIAVGSKMWLAPDSTYSALDQFLGTGSGGDDTEVMEVAAYNETPDDKNRHTMKTVGLVRHMDELPEIT